MSAVVLNLLTKYSIGTGLLTITADNAAFNGTLRKHLRNKVREQFDHTWNHEKGTINCMAHVVQLVLNCILKMLKVFHDESINEDVKQGVPRERYVFNGIFWSNTIIKVNDHHFA